MLRAEVYGGNERARDYNLNFGMNYNNSLMKLR